MSILAKPRFILLFLASMSLLSFACRTEASNEERIIASEQEISAAISGAQPGDILLLKDGEYNNIQIDFKATGLPDKPITLKAQTPGKVSITGRSRLHLSGKYLVVSSIVFYRAGGYNIAFFDNAENCRLTECTFIECGHPENTAAHIITLRNYSQKNRIDHCYMQGNVSIGMGVKLSPLDSENKDNTFDYNYFKDIIWGSRDGPVAIQIGQGNDSFAIDAHALVESCLFDNASGNTSIISNKSSSNKYRSNVFRNCKGGLVLRGGNNCLVEGNLFFSTISGVRLYGRNHTIINNYFEDVKSGILLPGGETKDGKLIYMNTSQCLIAHNTIINSQNEGISLGMKAAGGTEGIVRTPPFAISFLNNIIVSNSGVLVRDTNSRNITWQSNIVWPQDSIKIGIQVDGVIKSNPNLIEDGGFYRLSDEESPALDSAIVVKTVKEDIEGQPRDVKPDVGCDELSNASIERKPVTPLSVGPSWMRSSKAVSPPTDLHRKLH